MKNRKIKIFILIVIGLALLTVCLLKQNKSKFNINESFKIYNLNSRVEKDKYIEYLKEYIKPEQLRLFINNDYINFSQYTNEASGNVIIKQLEFNAYKRLFNSLFDKERIDFNDCPVTNSFKIKFKENLLKYFGLIESEDCESNCMLYQDENKIDLEVYGNFENTEPIYWKTYHFHYTLDSEGNVDDVIFDKKSD